MPIEFSPEPQEARQVPLESALETECLTSAARARPKLEKCRSGSTLPRARYDGYVIDMSIGEKLGDVFIVLCFLYGFCWFL